MKVLNLRCANGHGFEGWFGSDEDFMSQNGRSLIECPMCSDNVVTRTPSAPRLNLSGAREVMPIAPRAAMPSLPSSPVAPTTRVSAAGATSGAPVAMSDEQSTALQAAWLATVRHVMANTEDVGPAFAEEARRIHYGEKPQRGIRGQVSDEERESLQEEGIETMAIPVPRALTGPLQ